MTNLPNPLNYRERLHPGVGFFAAWALLIPAVTLVVLPLNPLLCVPIGIAVYALVCVTFFLLSPVISVQNGQLHAGSVSIPVNLLGEVSVLTAQGMKKAIGPDSDARNYLVVRGWINRGLKIAIADPADPTPFWIITCRKPQALIAALKNELAAGQSAA